MTTIHFAWDEQSDSESWVSLPAEPSVQQTTQFKPLRLVRGNQFQNIVQVKRLALVDLNGSATRSLMQADLQRRTGEQNVAYPPSSLILDPRRIRIRVQLSDGSRTWPGLIAWRPIWNANRAAGFEPRTTLDEHGAVVVSRRWTGKGLFDANGFNVRESILELRMVVWTPALDHIGTFDFSDGSGLFADSDSANQSDLRLVDVDEARIRSVFRAMIGM